MSKLRSFVCSFYRALSLGLACLALLCLGSLIEGLAPAFACVAAAAACALGARSAFGRSLAIEQAERRRRARRSRQAAYRALRRREVCLQAVSSGRPVSGSAA